MVDICIAGIDSDQDAAARRFQDRTLGFAPSHAGGYYLRVFTICAGEELMDDVAGTAHAEPCKHHKPCTRSRQSGMPHVAATLAVVNDKAYVTLRVPER